MLMQEYGLTARYAGKKLEDIQLKGKLIDAVFLMWEIIEQKMDPGILTSNFACWQVHKCFDIIKTFLVNFIVFCGMS